MGQSKEEETGKRKEKRGTKEGRGPPGAVDWSHLLFFSLSFSFAVFTFTRVSKKRKREKRERYHLSFFDQVSSRTDGRELVTTFFVLLSEVGKRSRDHCVHGFGMLDSFSIRKEKKSLFLLSKSDATPFPSQTMGPLPPSPAPFYTLFFGRRFVSFPSSKYPPVSLSSSLSLFMASYHCFMPISVRFHSGEGKKCPPRSLALFRKGGRWTRRRKKGTSPLSSLLSRSLYCARKRPRKTSPPQSAAEERTNGRKERQRQGLSFSLLSLTAEYHERTERERNVAALSCSTPLSSRHPFSFYGIIQGKPFAACLSC